MNQFLKRSSFLKTLNYNKRSYKESRRELISKLFIYFREIDDSKDFAITKLVKELLEFADSIKRCRILAEEKSKESPNDEYLKKMIDLQKQLQQFLKLYDVEEFDPINQPFDPNTSESLVTIPTPPGYQKNNVATTMMTGYRIKTRLLRSAKVGIFV